MERAIEKSELFYQILTEREAEKSLNWIRIQGEKIHTSAEPNNLFISFSQASRYFKKVEISPSNYLESQIKLSYENLDVSHWTSLQVARTYLILKLPLVKEKWFKTINQLFETGDLYEQQALFAALPILPFQDELISRAIDGLRTNISLVFDAIALNNPFPATFFPESNWNQMVLKAIFMQRPLYRIQALDKRRNPALASIARDFAHERWAAGREVMPELWRLVSPFIDDSIQKDLEKVLSTNDTLQINAAILAIHESDFEPAKKLVANFPEISKGIEREEITWEAIGSEFQRTRV
jgi:hypothetical protein